MFPNRDQFKTEGLLSNGCESVIIFNHDEACLGRKRHVTTKDTFVCISVSSATRCHSMTQPCQKTLDREPLTKGLQGYIPYPILEK